MEYTPEFEMLWKIKPNRAGGNAKPLAFKQYKARLKERVLYSDLQAGLLRYYNYCRNTGILNTQFTMSMARFLGVNEEGWTQEWSVPVTEIEEKWQDKAKRLNITPSPGDSWESFEQKVRQAR